MSSALIKMFFQRSPCDRCSLNHYYNLNDDAYKSVYAEKGGLLSSTDNSKAYAEKELSVDDEKLKETLSQKNKQDDSTS